MVYYFSLDVGELIMQQFNPTEIKFTATEINLVHNLLNLINVKLRNNQTKMATVKYTNHGALVTRIPKSNKPPLIKIHYTAKEAIQYLGMILRTR